MLARSLEDVTYDFFYTAAKAGKAGLTDVLVTVYPPTGAGRTPVAATEVGQGLYRLTVAGSILSTPGNWRAVAHTADATVDCQDMPALWIVRQPWVERIDAAVSSRVPMGVPVTLVSPVTQFGALVLYLGSDYLHIDGQAPAWIVTNGPDFTGATVELTVYTPTPQTLPGAVANAGTAAQTVFVDLTRVQLNTLGPLAFVPYEVRVTLAAPSGHILPPLAVGTLSVEAYP